jgi:hypothetical protein
VTTAALVLAIAARGLLIESDADGGILGARYGCWLHGEAPSLASLVASLRPGIGAAAILDHTQTLPTGTRAVLAHPAAEDAIGPVQALPAHLDLMREVMSGEHIVLDIGCVRPDGPGLAAAAAADALVVISRPTTEALACLLARLPILTDRLAGHQRLVVALRGEGPYRLGEIAGEARTRSGGQVPVVALPDDPRSVTALARTSERDSRQIERGALMRAARQLADLLDAVTEPGPEPDERVERFADHSTDRHTAREVTRR